MSYRINLLAASIALLAATAAAHAFSGNPPQTRERAPVAPAAQATLQGRLELTWGDAHPGAKAPHRLEVTLIDDAGRRHALAPDRAIKAASDLYALAGRRVAMTLAPQVRQSGRAQSATTPEVIVADAIVAIDDLAAEASQGGRSQTKAGDIAARVAGTTVWATLMCKFRDIATEQKARSFFQGQYGNSAGQLDHYWRQVSYNQINLTGSTAYGWFTLPQARSYYVTTGTDGKPKADLGKLFTDCTAVANASVNFAANGGLQGINMMFNGDLDGYAWGGGRCATLDGVNKCWSTTWNPPWSFNNLAPLAHEMGHAYGLPHANNSDNDGDTYDNPWDVMSDAWDNAVSNATYGSLPKHLSVYSRDRLAWIAAARKRTILHTSAVQRFTLDRASLAGSANTQMVVLPVPGSSTRYYTVEARKRIGAYEANLAGDAVIVHSVDTTRASPAWSMDASVPPATVSNNEGSMFKVGETWNSPEPTGQRFRMKVISATTEGFTVEVTPI